MLTVLLTGTGAGDDRAQADSLSDQVARQLTAAGHHLMYCQAAGGPDGGCCGGDSARACRLERDQVDVVVAAVDQAAADTVAQAAVCALLHGIPLVACETAGGLPDRPPWDQADARCAPADVVAACQDATAVTSPTVRRAVLRAARRVLLGDGNDTRLSVSVRAPAGRPVVAVEAGPLPPRVREQIRDAVRAALARYTGQGRYAEVLFLPEPARAAVGGAG